MSHAPAVPPSAASDSRPPIAGWVPPLLMAAWMGLGGYWWLSYSGPYRWLAELQMARFGGHVVVLTVALPIVVGLLASERAVALLTGTRPTPLHGSVLDGMPALRRLPLYSLFILLGGGAFTAYEYRKAAALGELRAVTPDDLLPAPGAAPARYVEVTGTVDPRTAWTEDGGDTDLYFLLRGPRTAGDAPAPVVVSVPRERAHEFVRRDEAAGTATVRGVATRGMKGPVRGFFEQQGVVFTAEPWVLEPEVTPGSMRSAVWFLAGFTVVGAVVAFFAQRAQQREKLRAAS